MVKVERQNGPGKRRRTTFEGFSEKPFEFTGASNPSSSGGFMEDMAAKMQPKRREDEGVRTVYLYRATIAANWETASKLIAEDHDMVVTGQLNLAYETALHIAVEAGSSHVHFVEKLVEIMSEKDLKVQNKYGNTALSIAAIVGNTAAAKILVNKNQSLLYICNKRKLLPVHEAALNAHKDTLMYLQQITNPDTPPYAYSGKIGSLHIRDVVFAEFYDVALDLIKRYPQLATMEVKGLSSPLEIMCRKVSAFPSGTRLSLWERLVYSVIQVKLENPYSDPNNGDIETASSHPRAHGMTRFSFRAVYQRLHFMLSQVLGFFVPRIKDKKLVHCQALQLVINLCKEIASHAHTTQVDHTEAAVIQATINDIPEAIEEIVGAMPIALRSSINGHYIFQLAVVNRSEKVFNLIYQMGDSKQSLLRQTNYSRKNILHLAGEIAPPHKLNLVSGAALQMQREIQWSKEVEKFVTQADRLNHNSLGKTPGMVFTEEHKDLVVSGEKWMKDTANSCTIAAALIITIVFAAAITVPGGLDQEKGNPIFSERNAFKIFFISNAISLFTSTTSLLMFLSILTARYAEQDFLFTLPNRLIIGLVTLFAATTSMMIAFSSIFYLVFGEGKTWSIIAAVGLACLPVTLFLKLQCPLLVDMITSTYGRGIFGKQSNRRLY